MHSWRMPDCQFSELFVTWASSKFSLEAQVPHITEANQYRVSLHVSRLKN